MEREFLRLMGVPAEDIPKLLAEFERTGIMAVSLGPDKAEAIIPPQSSGKVDNSDEDNPNVK